MPSTTRLTLRLPEELADEITLLVNQGRVPSASAVARRALESHLAELRAGDESSRRVTVRLPGRLADEVEALQSAGELPGWETFVFEAVKAQLTETLKNNALRELQIERRLQGRKVNKTPNFLAP